MDERCENKTIVNICTNYVICALNNDQPESTIPPTVSLHVLFHQVR